MTYARRRLFVIVAAVGLSALAATPVLGHASLVSSTPADGARVTTAQAAVVALAFDEPLDPARSSFDVAPGGGGDPIATGTAGSDLMTMSVGGLALAPGSYEARWTAWTTSDGHLTRGIVSFLVVADPASAVPSADSAGGPSSGSSASSAAVASAASPSAVAPAAPGDGSGSGGEVMLPIVAALAIVVVLAVALLRPTRVDS